MINQFEILRPLAQLIDLATNKPQVTHSKTVFGTIVLATSFNDKVMLTDMENRRHLGCTLVKPNTTTVESALARPQLLKDYPWGGLALDCFTNDLPREQLHDMRDICVRVLGSGSNFAMSEHNPLFHLANNKSLQTETEAREQLLKLGNPAELEQWINRPCSLHGDLALIQAVKAHNLPMIEALISLGADPFLINRKGVSAAGLAVRKLTMNRSRPLPERISATEAKSWSRIIDALKIRKDTVREEHQKQAASYMRSTRTT